MAETRGMVSSSGGDGGDLDQAGAGERQGGAGGLLGALVRPLPDDRPRDRRAGEGVRREGRLPQAEHRRLPERGDPVRHSEHTHGARLQGRGEEGERHRGRAQEHPHRHHREVPGALRLANLWHPPTIDAPRRLRPRCLI
uniref:Transcription initiation factor TFIID subunit 1 n=1 Tax=Anthurium amnicola TaxID=1678845 RepID=A0A1D1XMS1_9ARAE